MERLSKKGRNKGSQFRLTSHDGVHGVHGGDLVALLVGVPSSRLTSRLIVTPWHLYDVED